MIGTIGYLVKVDRWQWLRAMTAFTVAAPIAGGALALGLWGIGTWLTRELGVRRELAFAILLPPFALAYALTLTGRLRLPFRGLHRQVPKLWWDDYGPFFGGGLYGLELGTGVTTYVIQPSYWILLAWVTVLPDPRWAVLAMGVFALAMTLPVWVGSLFATLGFDVDDVSLWAVEHTRQVARVHAVAIVAAVFLALLAQ